MNLKTIVSSNGQRRVPDHKITNRCTDSPARVEEGGISRDSLDANYPHLKWEVIVTF